METQRYLCKTYIKKIETHLCDIHAKVMDICVNSYKEKWCSSTQKESTQHKGKRIVKEHCVTVTHK